MSDAFSLLPRPRLQPVGLVAIAVLITIVLVFAIIRATGDIPHIFAGTVPDDDFAERYVAHPWLAYLHIAPGVVYLLGAPLQLSRRFRVRHYAAHKRLGRVLLSCALLGGLLGLIFGLLHSWGGALEAVASFVFGVWFVLCLVLAFRAIRRNDVGAHRRWMIRAFAIGIGVGTIRIWVGLFTALSIAGNGGPEGLTLPGRTSFGLAFWLGFTMHVCLGELWLRRTPDRGGQPIRSR